MTKRRRKKHWIKKQKHAVGASQPSNSSAFPHSIRRPPHSATLDARPPPPRPFLSSSPPSRQFFPFTSSPPLPPPRRYSLPPPSSPCPRAAGGIIRTIINGRRRPDEWEMGCSTPSLRGVRKGGWGQSRGEGETGGRGRYERRKEDRDR